MSFLLFHFLSPYFLLSARPWSDRAPWGVDFWMSLNIFIVGLCTVHSGALLLPSKSRLCHSFDSFLITESSWIRDTCSSILLYMSAEMLQTGREDVRRESTEADFLSCRLHLSFYGQQRGPSLPLMALTAYFTALHSLFLYYSLRFLLPKWTLVCAFSP